jgi:predicted MFS family arabinose efflux permease
MTAVDRRATYAEVLAEPRFRVLLGTRTLAVAADSLRVFALATLTFTTTGSPLLGAVAFGIGFVPQLLGTALFGAAADTIAARPLIAGGYGLEFVVALVLALGNLPIGVNLALVATVAMLTPVFAGAANRLVAQALTGDGYVLGRSLFSVASSGAQLLGLAGGGLAVAAMGSRRALLLTAALHLVAALAARLGLANLPASAGGRRGPGGHSWRGNRRLLADRRIRLLLLAHWLPPLFVVGAESLLVPYAAARGYPAGAAGLLLACLPAGMIVGNLLVGRLIPPRAREHLVTPLIAAQGLPLVVLAAAVPEWAAAALLATVGAGFGYVLGLQRPFLDAVPVDDRGLAFGLQSSGLMTAQGIGPALFGALAVLSGTAPAVAAAGAATVATAALLYRACGAARPPSG